MAVGSFRGAVDIAPEHAVEVLEWARHREPAKSPTAVYGVRIPADRIEELRQLAAGRDVQPTALIRTWVLAQLDAARSPEDYAQRWERDVRATAEQLRKLLDERLGAMDGGVLKPWASHRSIANAMSVLVESGRTEVPASSDGGADQADENGDDGRGDGPGGLLARKTAALPMIRRGRRVCW